MNKPSSITNNPENHINISIIISANAEWKIIQDLYLDAVYQTSPFGEYFYTKINQLEVLFFHGAWGKISAAASTQYVIDKWGSDILINLGTCGAWGSTKLHSIILADKTIIYDIKESMGDEKEAINSYTTEIGLDWLESIPAGVIKTTLVSADKDILNSDVDELSKKYGAIAGDWESGAIAYVAQKNKKKIIILKGVSDLIGDIEDIGIGKAEIMYAESTKIVMKKLIDELPIWLDSFKNIIPRL